MLQNRSEKDLMSCISCGPIYLRDQMIKVRSLHLSYILFTPSKESEDEAKR